MIWINILQWTHSNGQQANEKKLVTIANNESSVNQNQNELFSHSRVIWKRQNFKILGYAEKYVLLIEIEITIAVIESSIEVSQKVKA